MRDSGNDYLLQVNQFQQYYDALLDNNVSLSRQIYLHKNLLNFLSPPPSSMKLYSISDNHASTTPSPPTPTSSFPHSLEF